ncbi:MAG: CDP-glycerol glycerophosphotransferase family protein [Spirochaetaceae bacterium]|jgi:hypothetical protein|nr:CDP-glycerol glycerophosphotransferase family protein [Spirochaetaceae bacterium]
MSVVILIRSFFVTPAVFKTQKSPVKQVTLLYAFGLKLFRRRYKPERLVNKIAILASEVFINHLETLFPLLNNDEYVFVVFFRNEEHERFLRTKNTEIFSIAECVEQKIYFKLLAVNFYPQLFYFPFADNSNLINFIAKEKLRLITNNFEIVMRKSYCALFDYVICCGNYYRKILEAHNIPRQKIYCYGAIRRNELTAPPTEAQKMNFRIEYGGYADKKTVLWIPAHSMLSTIYSHREMLATLGDRYNIFLKPHPGFELQECEAYIHEKLPRCVVLEKKVESVKLLPYADFVISDYGGTPLTVLMADVNMVLFNIYADFDLKDTMGPNAANFDIYLRKYIVNFNPDEGGRLLAALEDESVWLEQKQIRNQLIAEFFADNPNAPQDAVNLMRHIMRDAEHP